GCRRRRRGRRGDPPARSVPADVLRVEGQVRGDGSERGAPAEAAGGRESAAEAVGGAAGAGHPGAEGDLGKRVVAVADRRAAVTKGVDAGLSVRRSCRLVGLERKTFRYWSR